MKHTPYGYEIKEGKITINPEQAERFKQMCENYLSGMTLTEAAKAAGLNKGHAGVKHMMLNKRYLGEALYPQILDEKTHQRIKDELEKRARVLGRNNKEKKPMPKGRIYKAFTSPKVPRRFTDPIKQAEYAYSLIKGEEEDT